MTPVIYSWVYILPYSIYLIYDSIIPLYYFGYTSLNILTYLNTSCMKKISPKSLVFLIYHFYVQRNSICANNIKYVDSYENFHPTHFEVSSI